MTNKIINSCFHGARVITAWKHCNSVSLENITIGLVIIDISYLQCPFHPLPVESSCFSIASLNQRVVCVEHGPAVIITLRTFSLGQVSGNSVGIFVYRPGPRTFFCTFLCSSNEVDASIDLGVVGPVHDELVFHENVTLTNPLQQLGISESLFPPCWTTSRAWECHQVNK